MFPGTYTFEIYDLTEDSETVLGLWLKPENHAWTLHFRYDMRRPKDQSKLAALARKLGTTSEFFRPRELLGLKFIAELKANKKLRFLRRVSTEQQKGTHTEGDEKADAEP